MDKLSVYQTFVTVVKEGSLVKAAGRLNLTSSAVSKHLTQLEDEMGVALINRSTRSLMVTDAGLAFSRDCQQVLKEVNDAEARAKSRAGKLMGTLRISWPQVLMQGMFMRMLVGFREKYPDLKVESLISNRKVNLLNEDIDFSFRVTNPRESQMIAIPLVQTRSVVCATPQYIERVGMPTQLKDILAQRLILPTYTNLSDLRQILGSLGGHQDIEQYDSFDDAIGYYQAIRNGMGFGIVLSVLVEEDLKDGTLIDVLPDFQFRNYGIYLMYEKRPNMSEKHEVFKEFVKSYF